MTVSPTGFIIPRKHLKYAGTRLKRKHKNIVRNGMKEL